MSTTTTKGNFTTMQRLVPRSVEPKIKLEIMTVTPEIAAAWLENNVGNRKQMTRFKTQYARDMAAGEWKLSGDSIKFDRDRNLIDGQHRLAACVEAGVNFETVVAYGFDRDVRNVVDTGRARAPRDILTMNGVPNAPHVASTLKLLVNQKRGITNIGGQGTISHSELMDALDRHPSLPLYVYNGGVFPRGIQIAAVSYINYVACAMLGQRDEAERMIEVLKTGKQDYDGDPIHKFRERVIKNYADTKAAGRNRDAPLWTLKKAWNMFVQKKSIERLQFADSDVDIEGLDLSKL